MRFTVLTLCTFIIGLFCTIIPTHGIIIFSNEYTIENTGNAWVIDATNSTNGLGNIVLQFGSSIARTLSYDTSTSRFVFDDNVSFSQKQLQDAAFDRRSSAPPTPVLAQVYFNTTTSKPYMWNGSTWVDLTEVSTGSSKVVTVGTGQDYSTLSSASTYLSSLGGGIVLLTPEVHQVTTTVNLQNIAIIGRDPANTTIQLSGNGVISTGSSRFSYLSITALSGTTSTRILDLSTGASQVRFEDVKVTINDPADTLIGSTASPAPTASITFIQSEQVGANGSIMPPIVSSGLNGSTKITIAGSSSNNLLRINDWPVTIRDSGNVLTSGSITPIPANEIKLIPGMNIQGAINSLPSGGYITLLAGTYTISAPLQIGSNNLTISGSGDGSVITQSGFSGITTNTAAIEVGNTNGSSPVNNVVIKDFKLLINENIHGIKVTGGDDNQIQNVSVQKMAGTAGSGTSAKVGIMILDSTSSSTARPVIKGCRITGNGGTISFTDGIHVSGDTASSGTWGYNQGVVNALIEGNNIDYVRETGFVIANARGSSLFNNRVRRTGVGGGSGSLGIYITRVTDFSMVANVFTGTIDASAKAICIDCFDAGGVRSTTDSVFTDNLIDGNADSGSGFAAGIALGATNNTSVHRNIVQANSIVGAASGTTNAIILTGDGDKNTFADNTITGGITPWTNGINITNITSEQTIIEGTRFTNTTNPIIDNGASTQFGGYIVKNTTNPSSTDDGTKGYDTGLIWINTATNRSFILVNSTPGNALWKSIDTDPIENISREFRLLEDWIANTAVGNAGWTTTNSGTGAASTINTTLSDANHPGILQMTTGSTTTGNTRNYLGTATMLAGGGKFIFETLVQIPTLSTAANEFDFRCGFGDGTNADFTDGIYFEYNRNSSTNWLLKTANNGTRSTVTSSTSVSAGAWVQLKVEVSDGGTSVNYYIDNTLAGTISTNIPTSTGRQFAPLLQLVKSAGTTAANTYIDYFILKKEFTPIR